MRQQSVVIGKDGSYPAGEKQFQAPSQGWPGLTNGKARAGAGRAIRFAPDPATQAYHGFETAS